MSITGYGALVSPFRIDILDAGGNILGDGPLVNVSRLDTTARLDAIGECKFEMPAADPRSQYIAAGRYFDVWEFPANDRSDGYLGRFVYKSKRLTDSAGIATLEVTCYDALRNLSRYSVNFRRVYDVVDVMTVVDDLVSVVPGWDTNVDTGIGSTSVTYEGESVLAAIDVLRDRWGKHYRLQSTNPALNVLEFGEFGDDSGVRLANLKGQEQAAIQMKPETALVTSITLVDEADEIINSIIPFGAGQGVSQLTIEQATAGTYTVHEGANEDGSSFWYIQDAASVAAYGERWKVLSLPQVRPISNSDTGIAYAADALKLMAEAYIIRHLVPKVTYAVDVIALRKDIQVGDTVRLQYRGVVEGYSYIDIDDDFYVLDVAISRDVSGNRTNKLTIATAAERRTTDADIVVDVVRDITALKMHVPITLAYAPIGPYTRRMDSTHDANFTVRIKEEIVYCNRALLRFKTSPLRSSATAASSGGGATAADGGDHRHAMFYYLGFPGSPEPNPATGWATYYYKDSLGNDEGYPMPYLVTAPPGGRDIYTFGASGDHTHIVPAHAHDLTYGIYEDSTHPQTISLEINGIDRTVELGGQWALTNVSADVEIDITDFLVNAVGGLQQNHSIVFSCASGQGEIEAEIDLLVSIQAIAIV